MAETAVKDQDFYAILGVESDVETEDLKKIYRKLLLKHHPDKNPDDPKAADKFKAITTAYDVISDPVKRAQYDSRSTNSDDVLINLSLKEAATGCTRLAHVGKMVRCTPCSGIGAICPQCEACEGRRCRIAGVPCGACEGRGFMQAELCTTCKGNTTVEEFDTSRVELPPGVKHGFRIDIPGKSRQVRVNILPSKVFKRSKDDISSTLELTAEEAAEGGPFEIDTLYGKDMVFLSENVAHGHEERLEGKGMPVLGAKEGEKEKGDHVLCIHVKQGRDTKVAAGWDNSAQEKPAAGSKRPAAAVGPSADAEAKKAKTTDDEDELAKLLAEKKRALLASLGL